MQNTVQKNEGTVLFVLVVSYNNFHWLSVIIYLAMYAKKKNYLLFWTGYNTLIVSKN